jgi:hypothetical protein
VGRHFLAYFFVAADKEVSRYQAKRNLSIGTNNHLTKQSIPNIPPKNNKNPSSPSCSKLTSKNKQS